MPKLATEFVSRGVTVIYASGSANAALAAKAATTTIPIVFANGGDPVASGLVANINRPEGNVTGATSFTNLMGAKRLGILKELLPKATVFAMLINPDSAIAEPELKEAQAAATVSGVSFKVFRAHAERDFDAAFSAIVQMHADGLIVGSDPYFFQSGPPAQ